nr:hypothetical protein [uncultured Noviherbaspirillum sp.]
MTMENPGHEQTKPTVDNVQPPTAGNVPNPSRRRFNRAGVGASAVVMTLASRSVMANMTCTTPSGFHSANLSRQGGAGDAPVQCRGLSYQDWMAAQEWNPPRSMLFSEAFGTIPREDLIVGAPASSGFRMAPSAGAGSSSSNGSSSRNNSFGASTTSSVALKLKDATLEQAMLGSQTPLVIKHLIAALLNARSNRSTNPSVSMVLKIFADWNSRNSYEVSGGVMWSTDDIIEYLQYSQTPGAPTFPPKRS